MSYFVDSYAISYCRGTPFHCDFYRGPLGVCTVFSSHIHIIHIMPCNTHRTACAGPRASIVSVLIDTAPSAGAAARGRSSRPGRGGARTRGQPGRGQPGRGQPRRGQPRRGQPRRGQPGADSPGADSPGTDSPGADSPGADSPARTARRGQPRGRGLPGTRPPRRGSPTRPGLLGRDGRIFFSNPWITTTQTWREDSCNWLLLERKTCTSQDHHK